MTPHIVTLSLTKGDALRSMRYVLIPGRHPEISRAEFEAARERDGLTASVVFARDGVILIEARDSLPPDFPAGLGGMVKWGEIVGETSCVEGQVVKTATDVLVRLAAGGRGKFEFGLSFYESNPPPQSSPFAKEGGNSFRFLSSSEGRGKIKMGDVGHIGLSVKKNLKAAGIASRWVQSRERTLSSVVVKTNHLTDRGVELCFFDAPSPNLSPQGRGIEANPSPWRGEGEGEGVKSGRLLVARTTAVQAFDEFSFRDYGRPARDVRSGMIPVKLARMLINLSRTPTSGTLLDPFCGSGTILTEAAIMGFREVIGNDLESRAIESSAENLAWVREHVIRSRGTATRLVQGPAEKLDLTLRGVVVDGIATEPYLGPPLRGGESERAIQKIKKELEAMYVGAFRAFARVLRPGGYVAIIFPVFRRRAGDVRLEVLDDIKRLGFTPLSLRGGSGTTDEAISKTNFPLRIRGTEGGYGESEPSRLLRRFAPRNDSLIYSRPDQRVLREVRVFRYVAAGN